MKVSCLPNPKYSPHKTTRRNFGLVNNALRQRSSYGKRREKFTGKELDAETGLYYYGARYLDPKTSRWLSGDPAMGEYFPVAPINDDAKKHNQNLPGQGGVFNYVNLHAYHYAGNNPIKYTDPDGRSETEYTEQGRDIHAIILEKYIEAHPNDHVEGGYTSMSSVLTDLDKIDRGQGRTDIGLKPDIWNVSTGDVYEIKPAAEGVRSAKEQALLYVSLLNKFGEKAQLGNSLDSAVIGAFIYKDNVVAYMSPQKGVILYHTFTRQSLQEVAQGATALGMGYLSYKIIRAIAIGIFSPPVGALSLVAP